MNVAKLLRPITFGIVILVLFIFLVKVFGENADVVKNTKESAGVNLGFALTYTLVGLAVLAVLAMTVIALINKPKSLIVMVIGLGAIVLFYFIGYSVDPGEVTTGYSKGGIITTETASKMVGGVLNATLIVLAIAVGFSIFTSIRDLINKING